MSLHLSRLALSGFVSVCLLTSAGCAARQHQPTARPWLEKPPEQWTQADAKQVLENSAWVRVRVKRVRSEFRVIEPTFTEHCTPMNHPTDPHRVARDSCSYSYNSGSPGSVSVDEYKYEFVWESPVVSCRAQALFPGAPPCESRPDSFSIRVFSSEPDSAISHLVLSSGKKIYPTSVVRVYNDFSAWTRIYFPVCTAAGRPTIDASERWAMLTPSNGFHWAKKVKFDLRQMVTPKGPDLYAKAPSPGCAPQPSVQPEEATAGPWLKPPEQWTQRDAEFMLQWSPWVRRVRTVLPRDFCHSCSGYDRETELTARWESAESMCRAEYLLSLGPSVCGLPRTRYRIVVQGLDFMGRFSNSKQEIGPASLRWKGGELSAARIRFLTDGFVVEFPAVTSNGAPAIPLHIKEVVLHTVAEGAKLKFKFDLRKMVTVKGRDL